MKILRALLHPVVLDLIIFLSVSYGAFDIAGRLRIEPGAALAIGGAAGFLVVLGVNYLVYDLIRGGRE